MLQEVHVNQRVESATLKFNEEQENRPEISIDGITYRVDSAEESKGRESNDIGPIEEITVSRVLKYQDEPDTKLTASKVLKESIKKKLLSGVPFKAEKINFEKALSFVHGAIESEVQIQDFRDWFEELATEETV